MGVSEALTRGKVDADPNTRSLGNDIAYGSSSFGRSFFQDQGDAMSTTALIVIILVILLLGGGGYGYRAGWGAGPVGGIGLIILVLIVLLLVGVI